MATPPSDFRVITCYYRPKPGGLCKRLFQAIEALLAAGGEIHYLSVIPFPIRHARCHFHRFPWPAAKTDGLLFWGIFHLLAPPMLLYLGLRHRATHAFAFNPSYGFVFQLLRILKRIPLAVFLRADLQEHHHAKGRAGALLKLELIIEGLSIVGAHVYPVSDALCEKVRSRHRLLRPERLEKFSNNIPQSVSPIRAARGPAAPLRFGCVGTFDRVKNHALAIRCMAQFRPDQARLLLYGAGTEEEALRNLTERLGVVDRVEFMGWADKPEHIWANIDILLFPSLYEGSPNAVLEAIANGVPVLASDIPEHREIFDPTSLLPVDDERTWSEAIGKIHLSTAEDLLALRDAQQRFAARLRFDWDAEILKRILD